MGGRSLLNIGQPVPVSLMGVRQLHYPKGSPLGFCEVAVRSFFAQHFYLNIPNNFGVLIFHLTQI